MAARRSRLSDGCRVLVEDDLDGSLQVTLLMEMLNLGPWSFYPLTLQFLSTAHEPLRKGLPVPPPHMRVDFAPMEVSAY